MTIDWSKDWLFYIEGHVPKIVHIPHDAMLEETRSVASNNGDRTGYYPGGKYVYEKTLMVTEDLLHKDIRLHFDGVYRHTTVRLNGESITTHAYGYTPFDAVLTGRLIIGENKVQVEVDNSYTPNSRWYSGSGILRPVSLIVREPHAVGDLWIKTISCEPAVVQAIASCKNGELSIFAPDGTCIYTGTPGIITIPDAKLWDADHPHVYTAVLQIGSEQLQRTFGIRKLEWRADKGLLVNGHPIKLRGCCIHSDNGILGACSFPDAEERKIRILKESGYNAIRSAHNPASEELLNACDKLGMYVMDELYDGWYKPKTYHDHSRDFDNSWKMDVESWVQRDKHHPSVIMYSIGNEVTEPATEQGVFIGGQLSDAIRKIDDTRPITCGINIMLMKWNATLTDQGEYKKEHLPDIPIQDERGGSAFFNALMLKLGSVMGVFVKGKKSKQLIQGLADKLDIIGLNYGEYRYDEEAESNPKRLIVGSETLVSRQWYNWLRVEKYPNLIGDFVWTGFDYLGEANIGQWYYEGQRGLPLLYGGATIDITGHPDAQLAYQQIIWGARTKPYLGVRPLTLTNKTFVRRNWRMTDVISSWTWHGYEGQKTQAEIFTTAPRVALYQNGKYIGKRKTKHGIAKFQIIYQPGSLEAICMDERGNTLGRSALETYGKIEKIQITAESPDLRPNGMDLCYLDIMLVDSSGNVIPCDDREMEITVSGGHLAGFGSARPTTMERFDGTKHTTYYGRAQAIIRAGAVEEIVCIQVKSESLPTEEITIRVQNEKEREA